MKNLSLKRVIITGIVGIEVLTALVFLAAFAYHANKEAERHASDSIGWAQRIVESEVALFFRQMEAVADLTERLSRDDLVDFEDPNTLERYFFEAVKATPRITGMYYGAADGSFVFVTREAPDLEAGQTFTRIIDMTEGPRVERTRIRNADFSLRSARPVSDGDYDPRARPWYDNALDREASTWSDPYLFFTSGKPGVTVSRRIGGGNGAPVRGVAGVDLSLAGLSDFVAGLKISDGGKVFIADTAGRLLALPGLESANAGSSGTLPMVESGVDPILKAVFQAVPTQDIDLLTSGSPPFQFTHDGDIYVGAVNVLRSEQADWLIGAYAPLHDYLGWLDGVQFTTGWLTVGLAILGILGGWYLSRSVNGRLRRIESSAESFLSDEDAFDYETSSFSELRSTERALARMADDVAEREADLRALNTKLSAIMRAVDRMPIGIVVLRVGGPVSYVNALGAVVLDLKGDGEERADDTWIEGLEKCLRQGNGGPEAGWLRALLDERKPWRGEFSRPSSAADPGGPLSSFQLIAAPIGPARDEGWAIAIEDLSERKAMEANLSQARDTAEEASRAKSMFLANMSHELRTPLNSILGFGELMRQEAFGPIGSDRYREYAELIVSSGEALLEILSNLLNLTAIESGRLSLSTVDTDLSVIARAAVAVHGRDLEARGLVVDLHVPDSAPLHADPTKLRQAIGNLIQNAIRYADGATKISVTARVNTDCLTIVVEDDGVGLPEDRLASVLEPFQRSVTDSTLAAPDGVGLGLPIAKAMVELHGGALTLSAGEGGKGLRATITLPRAPKPATDA